MRDSVDEIVPALNPADRKASSTKLPAMQLDITKWLNSKGDQGLTNDTLYAIILFTVLSAVVVSSFLYR